MADISELVTQMKAQGVKLFIEVGVLKAASSRPLQEAQRQRLKKNKQQIIQYLMQNALKAAEERAAIMEYDGGMSRSEAEKQAINTHLKPYFFRTIDGERTYLSRCQTIDEARQALEYQFRNKLVEIEACH